MRWTGWFTGNTTAWRQGGNGSYAELAWAHDLEHTVFLQDEEAGHLIDALDRCEDGACVDALLDPYLFDRDDPAPSVVLTFEQTVERWNQEENA